MLDINEFQNEFSSGAQHNEKNWTDPMASSKAFPKVASSPPPCAGLRLLNISAGLYCFPLDDNR